MRLVRAALVATAILAPAQVHAGPLAPAPQIIAEYDRSFIERSGAQTFGEMLDTGIIRYFFTGGRDLLILVNGRPYATTAHNLDSLPLSAVERIEVLRAESLGTLGGHAAVRGAFNLVLRRDLDGFDVRTVARMPGRDGGEARQGSVVWGGAVGAGGHMTVGVDILDRNEIVGSTREHSRSKRSEGGYFPDCQSCLDTAVNEAQSSGGFSRASILAKTVYGSVLLPVLAAVRKSIYLLASNGRPGRLLSICA